MARTLLLSLAIFLVACQPDPVPRLENSADSLAYRVTEGVGGLAAWSSLHGMSWEWAVVRDSVEVIRTRHVWDKQGDRARVEWPAGLDSVLVAVFRPGTFDLEAPTGDVALNGVLLDGEEATARLVDAHGRFVNDGYWLLAPLKVLEPGVRRALDQTTGADRLALSFDGVGLTPGDRYWIEVEPVSGAMTGWSYILEGDTTLSRWQWADPASLTTEAGLLSLPRMKISDDERTIILTEPTALVELDETEFTDLTPRLRRQASGG